MKFKLICQLSVISAASTFFLSSAYANTIVTELAHPTLKIIVGDTLKNKINNSVSLTYKYTSSTSSGNLASRTENILSLGWDDAIQYLDNITTDPFIVFDYTGTNEIDFSADSGNIHCATTKFDLYPTKLYNLITLNITYKDPSVCHINVTTT